MSQQREQLDPVKVRVACVFSCPVCEIEILCHAESEDPMKLPDVVRCEICGGTFSNQESHPK